MKLGHIALRVKEIDKMLDYYCRGWGFAEAFRINNDDGSLRIVYVHIANHQYLELCLGGIERPEFDDKLSLGTRHISFTVENLEQTKKEMEARGVVFETDIMLLRDGNLTCFLFDPEGNKLEMVQTMPGSDHDKYEQQNPS